MPIAKKKSKLGELRLLMKLGNNDEELMEWFKISRTTLWRWKKELKEWEQQGKFQQNDIYQCIAKLSLAACDRCHFYFVDFHVQKKQLQRGSLRSYGSEILLEIEGI